MAPALFSKETVIDASLPQEMSKLQDLDSNQLLANDTAPVATFDQVRELGALVLNQSFDYTMPVPKTAAELQQQQQLLLHHAQRGNEPFFLKILFAPGPENHFPATGQVIKQGERLSLRLVIVPIHFGALEKSKSENYNDTVVALAAAAATAPHFTSAFSQGVTTTDCGTKKQFVGHIDPTHSMALSSAFGSFAEPQLSQQMPLAVLTRHMGHTVSLAAATHTHGLATLPGQELTVAAGKSKIAAGTPLQVVTREQLPVHALQLITKPTEVTGQRQIVSMNELALQLKEGATDLALVAVALGFTSQVVGRSHREKQIEKLFNPKHSEVALTELLYV